VSAIATTTLRPAPASALANIATIAGRNLRRLVRVSTLIAFATVQPILFVVLFSSVFGGAVDPPGMAHYIDYLLPGLFVLAIGFGASQTGVAIAEDLASGMIDRFRALPIAAAAVLTGRVAADAVRNLFVVALMIAVGSAMGFRFHAGPAAALAAVALAVAVGLAFSWLNLLLGLFGPEPGVGGTGRTFPRHHPGLHQLDARVGRDHARMARGLRQRQPGHGPGRCPARPLPRRPRRKARARSPRLDRGAPRRHRPRRECLLSARHRRVTPPPSAE
jgi:hypothetical protein